MSVELIIKKRVSSFKEPRRTNPKCGSKRLHFIRENAAYRAFQCHSCGQYVVEGDSEKFCLHQTALIQERMRREEDPRLYETPRLS